MSVLVEDGEMEGRPLMAHRRIGMACRHLQGMPCIDGASTPLHPFQPHRNLGCTRLQLRR
jgi:hypothetical protein